MNPFKAQFPRVIDSTTISTYKSCPHKAFLTFFEQWKPKELSVHLHAGRAFAKGVEAGRRAFYEGVYQTPIMRIDKATNRPKLSGWDEHAGATGDSEDSVACALRALLAEYGDFNCPPDSAKSAERVAGALEYYFTNYPLEHDTAVPITMPNGKRGIEFSFVQPIPILNPDTGEPLLISGRMDAITSFAGGIFVTDEKTTTQLGASWSHQWDLRAQFSCYCWGCRENGIKVDGVLVRGVSILKSKYDTQQAVSYRPNWQIDRWYHETLRIVESMVKDYEAWKLLDLKSYDALQHPFLHSLDDTCSSYGGCGFRQVCTIEDPNSMLDTYFERREWDPILREEKKL